MDKGGGRAAMASIGFVFRPRAGREARAPECPVQSQLGRLVETIRPDRTVSDILGHRTLPLKGRAWPGDTLCSLVKERGTGKTMSPYLTGRAARKCARPRSALWRLDEMLSKIAKNYFESADFPIFRAAQSDHERAARDL